MRVKVKALLNIIGAAVTAVLAALILFGTLLSSDLLEGYGLINIFLAALLSHLTIVARGLFLPAFLSLTQFYNPLVLGVMAGIGGGLGEMVAYYWGLGIKEALTASNEEQNKHEDPLPRWAERYGLIVAFLFASLPLPDTPIMLLAGALRFSPYKLLAVQLVGKSLLYSLGAFVGGFIFMELKSATEEITASILILLASIILSILVSWNKSREKIMRIVEKFLPMPKNE